MSRPLAQPATSSGERVRVVPATEQRVETGHGFIKGWGVTPDTAGARDLIMCRGVLPPGTVTTPHYHPHSQTAIYVLAGRALVYVGDDLQECHEVGAGDFLYIDRDVVHQPVNPSATEPHEFIQVRDTALNDTVEVPHLLARGQRGTSAG